jgi:hypothetical protein
MQVSLKPEENNGYFTRRTIQMFDISFNSFRMINIPVKHRKKTKHKFNVVNKVFLKSCRLWDNVWKYSRAGQATDGNMAHVHCMLARNSLRIRNSYCVSTAAAVLRTRLYVTLYLLRLSFYTYLCVSYLFIHAEPGWLIYLLVDLFIYCLADWFYISFSYYFVHFSLYLLNCILTLYLFTSISI